MTPLEIFIVDDDPDFAEGMALMLEVAGHAVETASSGEDAVRKFAERDFDMTFMDVRMPGMNGVESFFEIRKIKPDAKVMMMTAYSVEQLLEQAVDGGALGVLYKPISEAALLAAVKAAKAAGIVLLVDDDPDFAEGIEQILEDAGYAVVIARDGREAVDKAVDGAFDVLVLDLKLPVLSGLEVYLELKKRERTLATILVTGYAVEEADSIDALADTSVTGCLMKPVASEKLLEAIEVLQRE